MNSATKNNDKFVFLLYNKNMIKFTGKIIQLGFGAVGKSFFELIPKEIRFDKTKYFVITKNDEEFEYYKELGGVENNFIHRELNKENFESFLGKYLAEGDLLVDFAESVGTNDLVGLCAGKNCMYINTGSGEWASDGWPNVFTHENRLRKIIEDIKSKPNLNKYPIVLQHGNNPGLVSHFVKAGINFIVKKQTKGKQKKLLKELLKQNKFNEAAYHLRIRTIHINDIDMQEIDIEFDKDKLYNTWSTDALFFEMLSEAAFCLGADEVLYNQDEIKFYDKESGHVELNKLALETICRTYYPGGFYDGHIVPHDEIISLSRFLEFRDGEILSRPSVRFVYLPCVLAADYLLESKVEDKGAYEDRVIVRGYKYPKDYEIVYDEIIDGTEFVGALLAGENFKPIWVGNRVFPKFITKKFTNKFMYWQTPTITPVAASALAATCWAIKNKARGGVYLPEDIPNYKFILKFVEKYISKTIYFQRIGNMIRSTIDHSSYK